MARQLKKNLLVASFKVTLMIEFNYFQYHGAVDNNLADPEVKNQSNYKPVSSQIFTIVNQVL